MSTVDQRLQTLEEKANPKPKGEFVVVHTHDTDSPEEQQRVVDEAHAKVGPHGHVLCIRHVSTPLPGQV